MDMTFVVCFLHMCNCRNKCEGSNRIAQLHKGSDFHHVGMFKLYSFNMSQRVSTVTLPILLPLVCIVHLQAERV